MANQQQLALLRTGVAEWNEWRQSNPEVFIDLSEADLTAYTLSKANLKDQNFAMRIWKELISMRDIWKGPICKRQYLEETKRYHLRIDEETDGCQLNECRSLR